MDALAEAVEGARFVVISSLTWTHGTRLPVADVVDIAHDAGAMVLVDAVQSLGQHPIDVDDWGADFVAAAGHKWLLGVWGAGICYVSDDAVSHLAPSRIGYRSVDDPGAETYAYREGARRLEVGTASPAPHVAMAEAIEVVASIGTDAIEGRIEALTDRLKAGLGDRLVSPRDSRSGLVGFAAEDPAATVERLASDGIVARSLPDPAAVRVSVHALNTAEEVDALLAVLE